MTSTPSPSTHDHAGKSVSIWIATTTFPTFAKLAANEQADVCVVGIGNAGLTPDYLLGRAGVKPEAGMVPLPNDKAVATFIATEQSGRIWDREPSMRRRDNVRRTNVCRA